jgi:hypothetical protein
MLVGQAEKLHKFLAAMPLPYQTQYLPTPQINAGQQRQGTVALVFVIPPQGGVADRYRGQIRSRQGDGSWPFARSCEPSRRTTMKVQAPKILRTPEQSSWQLPLL